MDSYFQFREAMSHNKEKLKNDNPISLYLNRQADGLPRYILEQSFIF